MITLSLAAIACGGYSEGAEWETEGRAQLLREIGAEAPSADDEVELPADPGALASAAWMCGEQPLLDDAQLPPLGEAELPPLPPETSNLPTSRQGLAGSAGKMWEPGRTLRVRFVGGSAVVRSRVRTYAEQWTQFANIHFDFVPDDAAAEIIVSFVHGDGSWSRVGRDALANPLRMPTMNFGWFTDETAEPEFRRVILHEFGHALGMIHRTSIPGRGYPVEHGACLRLVPRRAGLGRQRM